MLVVAEEQPAERISATAACLHYSGTVAMMCVLMAVEIVVMMMMVMQ